MRCIHRSVKREMRYRCRPKCSGKSCVSVRTLQGVFRIEFGPQGLYAVRFPKNHRRVNGCDLSPLFKKLRYAKLDLSGYSDFQKRVYKMLLRVPVGKVITYGELARRAGAPGAARAVGTVMRKNRLPIAIPCHRVILGNGRLGQYSPGILWKRCLLRGEGVKL